MVSHEASRLAGLITTLHSFFILKGNISSQCSAVSHPPVLFLHGKGRRMDRTTSRITVEDMITESEAGAGLGSFCGDSID